MIENAETAQITPAEYGNVCISIDHLARRTEGPTVTKVVYSSEAAPDALLAQVDYFDQNDLLLNSGVINTVASLNGKPGAYVYIVNEDLTNVIVDTTLYAEVMAREGSLLETHMSLMTMALELTKAAAQSANPLPILAWVPN